ncbi:MAG: Gfo/Idh/MocA family oxidoreductase [Chthonomonas sp.]|nr:Gfo/Idh/MocA family oxidoreductase [Chthonomonas sp.]
MSHEISRRTALKGAALAAAMGGALTANAAQDPPRKRLRVGVIGAGGKGWSGMQDAAQFGDIVAIADVDSAARAKAMAEHPRANTFEDFRLMFEAMRRQMDAVIISTPDHTHAVAAAMALRHRLHTYCEKPLCRTISEVRQLMRLAKEAGVATQMGNQSTASTTMRQVAALIKSGHFGAVKQVHLWTDRAGGWWKQGIDRPAPAKAPKNLNFDLWLGPRPEREFGEGYHPFHWRGFWDFGTGSLGDMGCHIFNTPFMALDLRDPISVQATTSGHNRESFPAWAEVHYEFGKRGDRGPLDLFWYDGGRRPPAGLVPDKTYEGNGVIIICEKGTIYSPNEMNREFSISGGGSIPDVEVDVSPGHMAEFFRAATGGPRAKSDIVAYSGPLTETVLLGNLAIWADGPRLEWDAKAMAVKGKPEYDALLRPTFRKGYKL